MIVDTDFLDHWKTRLLVRLLGTETAPLYVLRLWAHCQQRKTDRFTDWDPTILASVTRWDTDGLLLWDALIKCRFIELEGNVVVVHDWAEANASLFSSWTNGLRGGRPCKSRPSKTQKPAGYPAVGHRFDGTNPALTHGVTDREEKRREDREEGVVPPPSDPASQESQTSNGEIVDAPEIPPDSEVLQFAAAWPGDMARAIPAGIPETWVLHFLAQSVERRARWPHNWKLWLVRRFTSDFVANYNRARGGATTAKASPGSPPSILTQFRQVQEELARHPGNPENGIGSLQRKKAEFPAFQELKAKCAALQAQLNP